MTIYNHILLLQPCLFLMEGGWGLAQRTSLTLLPWTSYTFDRPRVTYTHACKICKKQATVPTLSNDCALTRIHHYISHVHSYIMMYKQENVSISRVDEFSELASLCLFGTCAGNPCTCSHWHIHDCRLPPLTTPSQACTVTPTAQCMCDGGPVYGNTSDDHVHYIELKLRCISIIMYVVTLVSIICAVESKSCIHWPGVRYETLCWRFSVV